LKKKGEELGRNERKTKRITSRGNEKNQTSALERREEGTFNATKRNPSATNKRGENFEKKVGSNFWRKNKQGQFLKET
jgi:hypothetical protein